MRRWIFLLFKVVSYGALAIELFAIVAVGLESITDVCSRYEHDPQCFFAGLGLFVFVATELTVVPAFLALAGAVFLLLDTKAFIRRRAARSGMR